MTTPRGDSPSAPIDLSVLVPVYNNESTLEELLDRLGTVLDSLCGSWEVVLVDDGSSDASAAILRRRANVEPRLRVFTLARNFGSQAASCAAVDEARGARVVHIDADLENFPEDIPRLVAQLDGGFDLVCGYREDRGDAFFARRLPSLLFNAYVRSRGGRTIRDVGCGLRALDARLLRNLDAEGEGRRLLMPLLLRRAQRIVEVPVRHRAKNDRGGHSFFTLLGIAADYYLFTARRPFLVSALASAVACGVGVLVLVTGRVVEGLLLAGFGAVGGLLSLIGEFVQRLYHLQNRAPFYELRDPDPPR